MATAFLAFFERNLFQLPFTVLQCTSEDLRPDKRRRRLVRPPAASANTAVSTTLLECPESPERRTRVHRTSIVTVSDTRVLKPEEILCAVSSDGKTYNAWEHGNDVPYVAHHCGTDEVLIRCLPAFAKPYISNFRTRAYAMTATMEHGEPCAAFGVMCRQGSFWAILWRPSDALFASTKNEAGGGVWCVMYNSAVAFPVPNERFSLGLVNPSVCFVTRPTLDEAISVLMSVVVFHSARGAQTTGLSFTAKHDVDLSVLTTTVESQFDLYLRRPLVGTIDFAPFLTVQFSRQGQGYVTDGHVYNTSDFIRCIRSIATWLPITRVSLEGTTLFSTTEHTCAGIRILPPVPLVCGEHNRYIIDSIFRLLRRKDEEGAVVVHGRSSNSDDAEIAELFRLQAHHSGVGILFTRCNETVMWPCGSKAQEHLSHLCATVDIHAISIGDDFFYSSSELFYPLAQRAIPTQVLEYFEETFREIDIEHTLENYGCVRLSYCKDPLRESRFRGYVMRGDDDDEYIFVCTQISVDEEAGDSTTVAINDPSQLWTVLASWAMAVIPGVKTAVGLIRVLESDEFNIVELLPEEHPILAVYPKPAEPRLTEWTFTTHWARNVFAWCARRMRRHDNAIGVYGESASKRALFFTLLKGDNNTWKVATNAFTTVETFTEYCSPVVDFAADDFETLLGWFGTFLNHTVTIGSVRSGSHYFWRRTAEVAFVDSIQRTGTACQLVPCDNDDSHRVLSSCGWLEDDPSFAFRVANKPIFLTCSFRASPRHRASTIAPVIPEAIEDENSRDVEASFGLLVTSRYVLDEYVLPPGYYWPAALDGISQSSVTWLYNFVCHPRQWGMNAVVASDSSAQGYTQCGLDRTVFSKSRIRDTLAFLGLDSLKGVTDELYGMDIDSSDVLKFSGPALGDRPHYTTVTSLARQIFASWGRAFSGIDVHGRPVRVVPHTAIMISGTPFPSSTFTMTIEAEPTTPPDFVDKYFAYDPQRQYIMLFSRAFLLTDMLTLIGLSPDLHKPLCTEPKEVYVEESEDLVHFYSASRVSALHMYNVMPVTAKRARVSPP